MSLQSINQIPVSIPFHPVCVSDSLSLSLSFSVSIALPSAFVSMSVCVPLFLSMAFYTKCTPLVQFALTHSLFRSNQLTVSSSFSFLSLCVSERKNINLSTCVELKRVHKNNRQVKHASAHTIVCVCVWLVY